MRTAPVFLLVLGACGSVPAATGPSLRGTVFAGDDLLPAARVKGSAGIDFGGRTEAFDLGVTRSGPDGAFALPIPGALARAMKDPGTGRWWVRIHGEHDELLVCYAVFADELSELEDIRLQFVSVDPDLAKDVRDLVESLRTSPLKKHFRYGTDPVGGYGEAQEDFDWLREAAWHSRSAREAVRNYLKDADPEIQALAYEVLTLAEACPDASPEPPFPQTAEEARALIDWAFATIQSTRHGGHLAVGVDLDDVCTHCNGLWNAVDVSLGVLSASEALGALRKYEKAEGQARILRGLAFTELLRKGKVRARGIGSPK